MEPSLAAGYNARMDRESRLACTAAAMAFILLTIPLHARASELERQLRNEYLGKTFLLRGFYSGDRLLYDSSGGLLGKELSGDWTSNGFVIVDDLHMSGPRLVVGGRRLLVDRSTPVFRFLEARKRADDGKDAGPVLLEITADLGKDSPAVEETEAAMSRIFLTAQDSLEDLVAEYWNPCVREGVSGKNINCGFSNEVLIVPGVMPPQGSHKPLAPPTDANTTGFEHMSNGNGVSPPKVIVSPEPVFSEAARGVKYQGTTTLRMVVDTDGTLSNIRVIIPLGCGLDANAVEAVKTWKFKPAEKDGQPIPFEIAVEVDFHLY